MFYPTRPLSPTRRAIARFSLSETAKYARLTLALWIGFEVPYYFNYQDVAVALAGSAMLTLAFASSIAAARGYFVRRVVSNVVAMPLGTLVIWLTAPKLWLGALLLPVLVFAIVRVRPSAFQMVSVTIPMTLVLYTGEHIPLLEQRLIAVVLGMLLGLVIQQLVAPPDHGYRANTLVIEGSRQVTDTLAKFIDDKLDLREFEFHIDGLRSSSTSLRETSKLLELDLRQKWGASDFQRHRARLPYFRCYQGLFNAVVCFLETLEMLRQQPTRLEAQWTQVYIGALSELLETHRQLVLFEDHQIGKSELHLKLVQTPHELEALIASLPVTDVLTSVFLGYLTVYRVFLCQLNDLYTGIHADSA